MSPVEGQKASPGEGGAPENALAVYQPGIYRPLMRKFELDISYCPGRDEISSTLDLLRINYGYGKVVQGSTAGPSITNPVHTHRLAPEI